MNRIIAVVLLAALFNIDTLCAASPNNIPKNNTPDSYVVINPKEGCVVRYYQDKKGQVVGMVNECNPHFTDEEKREAHKDVEKAVKQHDERMRK